jgi:inorganic triphosphatase YgiF
LSELELKFAIEPAGERRLVRRLRELDPGGAGLKTLRLRSIYFDTADMDLARAGIALRLRRDGRRWVQTAKLQATLVAGLSSVQEIENAVHGANLDLGRIDDPAAREAIRQAASGKPLVPVFETLIRRRLCRFEIDGTTVEVAIDDGEIVAGERRDEVREAEVEYKAGDPAGIFAIAGMLFPQGGAIPSAQSKAAIGYRLLEATTGRPEAVPRLALNPEIEAEATAEEAARTILFECIAQISENIAFVRADSRPEGPHQLRVGLRRLRSAMALLHSTIGCPQADRLRQEARWLAAEVGALRDLDALVNDIILPSARFHVGERTLLPLALAFSPLREKQLAGLRTTLAGKRVQDFVLDLLCLVHTRGWRQAGFEEIAGDAGQPVEAIATDALDAVWRRVRKRARQIETLDIEARHELRKELKKLRYAIEFLGSLYPRRRLRTFLRLLKTLQETFGFLNDSAMAGRLLSQSGLEGMGIAGHDRAAGWISGEAQAKADAAWKHAIASWYGLKQARPFWH